MTSTIICGVDTNGRVYPIQVAHGADLSVCTQKHLTTYSHEYAAAQSGGVVISPAATKYLCIHSIFISTDATSVDVILTEEGNGTLVFHLHTTKDTSSLSTNLHVDLDTGKDLLITCGKKTFVQICYVEE